MIPGKPFDPATETSRRPTPEKFAHNKKWATLLERYIQMTTITELKDIDIQLEQFAHLYVNNEIHRVIAQLIGAYGEGFITLEATAGGALKVAFAGSGVEGKRAVIDFNTIATHEIVAGVAGKKIKITNLMFTVGGLTSITLKSETTDISGPLYFGGSGEPRGMVNAFGNYPLETAIGEAFQIGSSAAEQVSGYVTYYEE